MHPTLRLVERVEELLQRQTDDAPYDYKSLFPVEGFWARRASQKKLGFLKRIDESLRAMLWPGERVLFLTSGVLHAFWESYLFGLPMYYLNRRALALTTERLILLQIDSRRRPRELRSHVVLRAVDNLSRSILGNSRLRLKSGKTYTIAYVPRRDRKTLVAMIREWQQRASRESAAQTLEHLCPHCYVSVDGHPVQCPQCGGAFKSPRKAGLLSLVFPGLGDIYIGHLRFAILEILVAALIWLGVLLPDPQAPMTAAERLVAALMVFTFVHGGDGIGTWYVARKGHHPDKPSLATRAAGATTAA